MPVNEAVVVQSGARYSVRELTSLSNHDVEQHESHDSSVLSHEYEEDQDGNRFTVNVKHEHEPELIYVKDERDLNEMDECSTVIPVSLI